ncbi:MAG: PAS domain S-box protein [Cyclobacteriaceae bacterium]
MLKQLELLTNAITIENKGIGIVNEDGKFVWANRYLEKVYECPAKELIGQYFTNGFSEEDVIIALKSHHGLFSGNLQTYPPIAITYHANGMKKRLTLSGQAAILNNEERYCLLFMQETKSFREQAIVQRRQDSLFYSVVASHASYLVRIDLVGNYSFVNYAYERQFGSKEKYLAQPFHDSLHPDDIAKYDRMTITCMQNPGKPVMLELRKAKGADKYYTIRWEFMGVPDEQGRTVEVQGMGYNISEEQEAEQRLQQLDQLNRILLDISAQTSNTDHQSLSAAIQDALKAVTQCINFQWGLVYTMDEDAVTGTLTHEYSIPDAAPIAETAHHVAIKEFPWWRDKISRQETISIYDRATLPNEASHERYLLESLRIKSLLAVPITAQRKLQGYVVFATDITSSSRISEVIGPLKLLGTIFGTTFHQVELNQSLTDSRDEYKLLAENVTDMVSKHNLDGVYNYVSPSCKPLIGYEQHELLGTSAFDHVHPDDKASALKSLEKVLSGETVQYHFRKRQKNGEYRWMEITAKLIEENNTREIIASTRNIHQRKITKDTNTQLLQQSQHLNEELKTSQKELQFTLVRTQELNELLLRSEKKFRSLTEKSFDAIVVFNEDGLITYATPSVQNVIGYTSEELVGTYQKDYIFSEDLSITQDILFNTLQHPQKRMEGFFRLVRKDGKAIWTETITTNLLLDENIQGIVSNFRDVTEQRQGEQAIAEFSERLAIATQSANIGIWDWYIPKNHLVWDERTFAMFGIDPRNFTHSEPSWIEAIHPEDRVRVQSEIDMALQREQDFNTEYRIIHPKDQAERYIRASAKITRKHQQPIRMTGVNLDITNVKQVEQQLRENNEELRKTNAELDQFVYSTSHNLRAPLASVLGLISVLQGTTDTEERTQYLQLIESSIHRLDETIHEIIDYSRNARITLKSEPIQFREIVAGILDGLYFLRSSIDIDIRLEVPDNISYISDPTRLRTIFNNLLSNAIKYFNPHVAVPFVAITITPTSQGVEIVVEDNGVGINKAAQDKIFDMFYRASHHSTGSGLGLYIVKEAVEKLNGTITLRSQEGQGTAFTLQLPSLKD